MLSRYSDILLLISATLGACGIAITIWTLVVTGRARGQRRCRRCWYSMNGAISDGQGAFTCPECGRTMARESELFRTRRHWRGALVGLLFLLVGGALAGAVVLRDQNPWRFAPDILIINAIPGMGNWNTSLGREFARRKFVEENEFVGMVYNGVYERIDLRKYHVRKLSGFEQRLLARRAAAALEASPNHPQARQLLILLALSGYEKERAFKIVSGMVGAPTTGSADPLLIALLQRVAPDDRIAATVLTARLLTLVQNDPQLLDTWNRLEAASLVGAIGETGAAGVDSVPVLLAILPYESAQWEPFISVVRALGRIGPPAKTALPCLKVAEDLSDSWNGDRIDKSVATMLIDGTCQTEEEAFIRLLSHPNWRSRRAAAMELGRCPEFDDLGRRALLAALEDQDELVRETAAESLLDRGLEREACHHALLHPVPRDGHASMWAPVQIMWRYELDPTEAIPSLEEELKSAQYPDGIRDMINRIRRNDPFSSAKPQRSNR